MNRDLRAKWLTALRGGEYEQGRGHLYDQDKNTHCCLGVLTRILGIEYNRPRDCFIWPGDIVSISYIPHAIARGIRLTQETQELLAKKNDNGESFAEIADWIEANVYAGTGESREIS